jgi:hypothetical protein
MMQTELITDLCTLLEKRGYTHLLPRQINAVIQAADLILAELREPMREPEPGCGLTAWLESDATGASSRFMAAMLAPTAGFAHRAPYAHPYDPSDFGRCLGLLKACPELRKDLHKMAGASAEWARLVGNWDELEALYEQEAPTGQCPQLFECMKTLLTRQPF